MALARYMRFGRQAISARCYRATFLSRRSRRVADIAWIYSDVPEDYTLCELCIMSRFRPITPEDKGGIGAIV